MDDALRRLADDWWDGLMARNPTVATRLGDHRFDAEVEDPSPAGLADERAFAEDVRRRAGGIDAERLSPADRVTLALLVDSAEEAVESIDSQEVQLSSDGFTGYPVSLLRAASQLRAPDEASADAQLERLRKLPAALDGVVEQWRTGAERGWTPAAAAATRSLAMVEAYLAGPIEHDPFVALSLPDGWDGADAWRAAAGEAVADHVRPAYQRVADALRDLVARGRDDEHPGLVHVPGGDELYRSKARRATTTDLSPQQIHDIGMAELTEVLPPQWAEIGQRAIGVSDRAELFSRLRGDASMRYRDAQEILDVAATAIERALEASVDWFDRLPDAACVVEAVPDHLAPGLPAAYYSPPPGDGSRPGTYFANTPDATRRNRFEAETIAFHEAVPGHHLERALAAELVDVPAFQQRGGYMAYSEGWGLYAERLAEEMGLYSSDVMRLGMLAADAWRSARLVVDTGIHALGWSRQRALDLFVEHVPLDPAEAEVEIDRYIGMPGQALSYKVGQREIFRLREDARARLGERFDIKGFHTTVLEHGGVPLGLLGDLVDDWVARTLAA
ncbi:MAG: DUF885 domain-containing protein [Acidimicrobiia bacterium]